MKKKIIINMEKGINYCDILFDKEDINSSILLWRHIIINDKYKLNYRLNDDVDMLGFDFIVIEPIYGCDLEIDIDYKCEIIMKGYCYNDGLRHLYVGGEYGYLFFPEIFGIIDILKVIDSLIKKYCNDLD